MGFTHSLIYIYIFLEHSFIAVFCKVSRGQNGLCGETMFSLCVLTLFFPFTYTSYTFAKQGKPYGHLWQVWMSFMCRSDVVSDVVQITWDFQETSLLSRCRPQRMAAEQLSFQQSCFAYCCLKNKNVLAILVAAVASAHTSTLAPNTSTWAFCRYFSFSKFIRVHTIMIWMSF